MTKTLLFGVAALTLTFVSAGCSGTSGTPTDTTNVPSQQVKPSGTKTGKGGAAATASTMKATPGPGAGMPQKIGTKAGGATAGGQ